MKKSKFHILLLLSLIFYAIHQNTANCQNEVQMTLEDHSKPIPNPELTDSYDLLFSKEVVKLENGGYGYNILFMDKVVVRQSTIPLEGYNKPFDSYKDAEKVAEIALQKAFTGNFPIVISDSELKKASIQTLK